MGVVINEMSDASSWPYEFIELYYDAGAAQSDTTPPAAATDLSAFTLSDTQIRLTWTAPGDDGSTGTATAYDLRRSPGAITSDGLFAAATPVTGLSAPQGAGSSEQFVVMGLSASTTYYFALKTRDEVPNWSALSNSPSATTDTSSDVTPPAPIANLVATPQSDSQIQLTWTAPGDDGNTGTATLYEIRRSPSRILTDSDFSNATAVTGMTPPKAAGGSETFTVTGLTANTPYYFAVKTKDEAGVSANWSGLSNWASATTGTTGGGSWANHLVISQIRVAGSTDDFVELYNPTATEVSVSGWSVQYIAANSNFGFKVNLVNLGGAGMVPSHGWYLIAGSGYSGSPTKDDNLAANNMGGTAGHALLVSNNTNVSPTCTDTDIVDKVGYGATATCPEGGSGKNTAAPGAGLSVTRKPGGSSGSGQDTNINSDDFSAAATPVIHSSASTPVSPPGGLGNVGPTLYLAGSATADLGWANAASATGYRVYRGATGNFMAGSPSPWQTVSTNSVTDSSTPAPIYFYIIRATDGTNESAD